MRNPQDVQWALSKNLGQFGGGTILSTLAFLDDGGAIDHLKHARALVQAGETPRADVYLQRRALDAKLARLNITPVVRK